MNRARHAPLTAFLVGMLGIALFSVMDAVMKGLVLAIGTYATMLWRSLVGVAIAGASIRRQPPGWPTRPTLRSTCTRGALIDGDGRCCSSGGWRGCRWRRRSRWPSSPR